MPRKHLFPIVVLLSAAVVAGLLALTRTVDIGQASKASTGSDAAIAYRLKKLDRFERSLRKQLAVTKAKATPAAPQTIYTHATAPSAGLTTSGDDGGTYEVEHGSEARDD